MKIKDIICEPLHNFIRLSGRQTTEKAVELLQLVELSTDFAERYSANMSGGQRQRVAIARALALEPAVLVCDEATSALDVSVQKKVIDLLIRIQRERNLSILFICHDLALMSQLSHRIAVMYLGNIVEVIDSARLQEAKHPYTQALIQSVFPVDAGDKKPIPVLEGELPSPIDLPEGCPFQTRCGFRQQRCTVEKPILRNVDAVHSVACHLLHA